MSQASAYEQYILELINAERAKAGAQPLAFNGNLNSSAELHSQWMLSADIFSHTGSGGSNAGQRMASAGYVFSGSWSWAENIAWASTRSPAGYQDEALLLHTNLMNSPGHRANILNATFREIGIGMELGDFQGWDAAMLTQNFALTGGNPFLTGVAFDDKDGDRFYDVGEALGGVTVKITNVASGAVFTTTTQAAGGYQLALAAGTYSVTFSAAGLTPTTSTVTIGSANVKVDWIDPAAATTDPLPPPTTSPEPVTSGTSLADTYRGTSGNDVYDGLGGSDLIYGYGGNDRLTGGSGSDRIYGGSGNDTLTGGTGYDKFYFDTRPGADNLDTITDFSTVYDQIGLENAIFTAFTSTGTLASSAFHKGVAAADASDRVIYDPATGKLFYDQDGTGPAAAVQFAVIGTNLNLTYSDFFII
jgi:serralysin